MTSEIEVKNAWMIRSGGDGTALDLFDTGVVGIGFGVNQSLAGKNLDEIRDLYMAANPSHSKSKAGNAVAMLDKIANVIGMGDGIITYDPGSRQYWIGTISGPYQFEEEDEDFPHRRPVNWEMKDLARDDLTPPTRNSLGSTLTLFSLTEEIWSELKAVQKGEKPSPEELAEEVKVGLQEDKENLFVQARERLKDRIVALDDGEMEQLVAAVLRAMGFRTRVSAKGPDRGVDVMASPDGLGLQEPRIKVEVKHRRKTQMGAQDIRAFIGALRGGDRGIYLSTGGFSKEARYESERANVPVTLMDLEELARLIETHYESFDTEGRGLLPLTRVYWPAD